MQFHLVHQCYLCKANLQSCSHFFFTPPSHPTHSASFPSHFFEMSFSISDTRLAAIMLSQEMNRVSDCCCSPSLFYLAYLFNVLDVLNVLTKHWQLLRLPPSKCSRQKPVTSQLEPIDWDLCQDLNEWVSLFSSRNQELY